MYNANMSLKGCNQGCIYRKEIKLEQMKDIYVFRCVALKKYFTQDDIKSRCNLYEGHIKITEFTLDEFLQGE